MKVRFFWRNGFFFSFLDCVLGLFRGVEGGFIVFYGVGIYFLILVVVGCYMCLKFFAWKVCWDLCFEWGGLGLLVVVNYSLCLESGLLKFVVGYV